MEGSGAKFGKGEKKIIRRGCGVELREEGMKEGPFGGKRKIGEKQNKNSEGRKTMMEKQIKAGKGEKR